MKLSCSVSRDTGITLDGGAAVPWPSMAGAFSVHGDRCRGKLMARNFIWDPNHWRFRAEEARTVADQMTHEEARTIMRRALPTTTTILLRLPRSNWPLRKEEQLAID